MAKHGILVLALALVVTACGGVGAGATPQDTFEAMKKCAAKKDLGGFYDMMSPATKRQVEEQFETVKKQWADAPDEAKAELEKTLGDPTKLPGAREFFIKGMEQESRKVEDLAKATFVAVTEEGDKATVWFMVGEDKENMKMEKVDGKWFCTFD